VNLKSGEQHPGEGLFTRRRMGLVDVDGVEGKGAKSRGTAWGFEGDFSEADFDGSGA